MPLEFVQRYSGFLGMIISNINTYIEIPDSDYEKRSLMMFDGPFITLCS